MSSFRKISQTPIILKNILKNSLKKRKKIDSFVVEEQRNDDNNNNNQNNELDELKSAWYNVLFGWYIWLKEKYNEDKREFKRNTMKLFYSITIFIILMIFLLIFFGGKEKYKLLKVSSTLKQFKNEKDIPNSYYDKCKKISIENITNKIIDNKYKLEDIFYSNEYMIYSYGYSCSIPRMYGLHYCLMTIKSQENEYIHMFNPYILNQDNSYGTSKVKAKNFLLSSSEFVYKSYSNYVLISYQNEKGLWDKISFIGKNILVFCSQNAIEENLNGFY